MSWASTRWWSLVLVVIVVVLWQGTNAQYRPRFPDLQGNYCRKRWTGSCCDGRLDDCSVPILGTLCYCDQFCDRNYNPDCCPDYYEVCLGYPPQLIKPYPCNYKGETYQHGETVKINCNECDCLNGTLSCPINDCMVDETVIEKVNNNYRYGWRAANYSEFWGRTTNDGFTYRMGTRDIDRLTASMYPVLLVYDKTRIPRSFDARSQWGQQISGIRDQGWCGASWAFSTLGVAEDRFAIESNGEERVSLSTQNLISCDRRGQQGCKGGHLDRAWNYLRKYGVVDEECFPYESGRTSQTGPCRVPRGANLLTQRCTPRKTNRKDMYKMEPTYRIASKEEDIMYEILENGPVQATMTVHDDFFMYKSGVYAYTGIRNPERSAHHSVRIVGWGEDTTRRRPLKYWVVANSWGREWGEDGYFRIKRGVNESDIENFIITARARLVRDPSGRTYRTGRRADWHAIVGGLQTPLSASHRSGRNHKHSYHHKKHQKSNSV